MMLRNFLQQRVDASWELLATAAGNLEAIEKTLRGLSQLELNQGPYGFANNHIIVGERVEAIAAYDPDLLASLAKKWIDPHQISSHPFKYWWIAAWKTSLRYLKQCSPLERAQVDVYDLKDEVETLWHTPSKQAISWHKLAQEISHMPLDAYFLSRKNALRELVDTHLTASDIQTVNLEMLRILRGRTSIMEVSAQEFVITLGRECLGPDIGWVDLKDLVCADLKLELSLELDPGIREMVSQDLIQRLTHCEDPYYPQKIARIANVLLGNWHCP